MTRIPERLTAKISNERHKSVAQCVYRCSLTCTSQTSNDGIAVQHSAIIDSNHCVTSLTGLSDEESPKSLFACACWKDDNLVLMLMAVEERSVLCW